MLMGNSAYTSLDKNNLSFCTAHKNNSAQEVGGSHLVEGQK